MRAEACFLGGFVEDVGHRVVSAVAVARTWTDHHVVAEPVENLTAKERSASQSKRVEAGPPTYRASACATSWSSREILSPYVACCNTVFSVRVAQVR